MEELVINGDVTLVGSEDTIYRYTDKLEQLVDGEWVDVTSQE